MKTEQTAHLTRTEKSYRIKKLTIMAIMTAIAYLVTFFFHIKIFGFLSLEFKDAVLVFGSFIFGPLAGFIMTLICAFIELCTISTTDWIGLIMNIISSSSFVCLAAIIHKRKPCLKNAVIGLIIAVFAMTAVMMLWNYLITPLYMQTTREAVAGMLIPTFMPFNLLKGGLNASLAVMLYPAVSILEKAHLIPKNEDSEPRHKGLNIGLFIFAAAVLVTCVFFVLTLTDVI